MKTISIVFLIAYLLFCTFNLIFGVILYKRSRNKQKYSEETFNVLKSLCDVYDYLSMGIHVCFSIFIAILCALDIL